MSDFAPEHNVRLFDQEDIVADYEALTGLTPSEQRLFDRYIPPGSDVLDLGVGAGRTVDPLRSRARRYVGVDYAPNMIESCRRRFPGVEFHVADAADLGRFESSSFDAVVFSFNGIDCLYPDEARRRCIDECHRVLRPGGSFVLSVHNPSGVITLPDVRGLPPVVKLRRFAREGLNSARRSWNAIRKVGLRGDGYVMDTVHGGLVTHLATPRRVIEEMTAAGFEHLETLPSTYPRRRPRLLAIWYYFAFRRH